MGWVWIFSGTFLYVNDIIWITKMKHDYGYKSNCYGLEASFSFSCIVHVPLTVAEKTLCLFYSYLSFKQSWKKCVKDKPTCKKYYIIQGVKSQMSHCNIIITFSYRNLLDMWRLWHQRYCLYKQETQMNSLHFLFAIGLKLP